MPLRALSSPSPRYFGPLWRQDLNSPTRGGERSSVDAVETKGPCVAQFEHNLEAETLVPEMRKPFDVLVEGLEEK
jgi:hypothetical protein